MQQKKRLAAIMTGSVALGLGLLFVLSRIDKNNKWNLPPAPSTQLASSPVAAKLEKIPASSAIAFHRHGHIWVMDENGANATQISFEEPQGAWEHVAVSPDRRFIAANEQLPNPKGVPGGLGRLWVFDLQQGTRTRLAPAFDSAGNGGVDWDRQGNIYFAAKEKDAVPNPRVPDDYRANAGENDIYRIRPDGSGLQRLTHTRDLGEADVSVSEDGSMIAYVSGNIPLEVIEIWVAKSDGSEARLAFRGGPNRVSSVHDPELSPDNKQLVFSRVNSEVPPNFPDNPDANTAHDIYRANIDGSGLTRLTLPGHISIAPDWARGQVLFLDISEKERRAGLAVIDPRTPDQKSRLIDTDANIGKWIPERSPE
jgi:Tol biopolymer transport system component